MSLRIAQVSATFPPYRGGTGNVCYYNARELARRGHAVQVFSAAVPGAPEQERRDGFRIRRLRPLLRVGNAPLLPGLLPALRGFDIVHLHYPFFGGEITALATRLRRTPLLITYHQDVHLKGAMGVVAALLQQTLGRLALRSSARVLFTSLDYSRVSCARRLLRGREHTIGELSNGVDLQTFMPGEPPAQLRRDYRLGPDDRLALLVAGLDRAHYFKGVDLLLDALARLPQHIHGMIVGDGELRPIYQARAFQLGIADRVHFAGRVADADLPSYYRLADLTVLPSTTMGEAFGLVLIESLASGTPVIASALPGVRTVVDHGHDGLLVPPGDAQALAGAIAQLLGDDARRRAMAARGRARVAARYGWEQIGAQLEAIYHELLELRSTRSLISAGGDR